MSNDRAALRRIYELHRPIVNPGGGCGIERCPCKAPPIICAECSGEHADYVTKWPCPTAEAAQCDECGNPNGLGHYPWCSEDKMHLAYALASGYDPDFWRIPNDPLNATAWETR